MGRLFGTNGVRGVVNVDLTAEMVMRLAAASGFLLGSDIAVGRDGRTSSSMFRDAVVSGLLSIGCRVYDAGLLPTPALQFTVKKMCLDGGLMVTASHNPPEFNGLKVIAGDGVEVSRTFEDDIERVFFEGGPQLSPWNRIEKVSKLDTLEAYVDACLSHIDIDAVKRAKLGIALDPGNGVASITVPVIARKLGCSVYTINAKVDGRFPGRESEPKPENLGGLGALVEASEADVGVAFDGDGDRAIFVDELGRVHWGDRSFALVARDFLAKNPDETIATPVSSSRVIGDIVEAGHGRLVWTKVGSVVVSRTMVEQGIKLGGEENGGIMYGPHLPVRDGAMAMALILEIMAKGGSSLSELFDELPLYSQIKDRVDCPNCLKQKALEVIHHFVDAPKVETIDGLKLWYPNGSWILIRPSGTEPIFRLYAEAQNLEQVSRIIKDNKRILREVISSLE